MCGVSVRCQCVVSMCGVNDQHECVVSMINTGLLHYVITKCSWLLPFDVVQYEPRGEKSFVSCIKNILDLTILLFLHFLIQIPRKLSVYVIVGSVFVFRDGIRPCPLLFFTLSHLFPTSCTFWICDHQKFFFSAASRCYSFGAKSGLYGIHSSWVLCLRTYKKCKIIFQTNLTEYIKNIYSYLLVGL